MGWAQFRDGDRIFGMRAAGVAVDGGRVLLHRAEFDAFWSLPGGRLMFGETAEDALRREMREEIGVRVGVGPLVWVVENFFDHAPLEGTPRGWAGLLGHHEIGLTSP